MIFSSLYGGGSFFDIKKELCLNKLRFKVKPSLTDILRTGEYFGRLIGVGLTAEKKIFLLYGITGRSPASRARRLVRRKEGIFTEPLVEIALNSGQRELLVYPAILFNQGVALSNGQQTKAIAEKLALGIDNSETILKEALASWSYEPDPPIFTPRISACLVPGGSLAMAIIRRGENGQSLHEYYSLDLAPGEGYLLATYQGPNLQPPPSFSGPPLNFMTSKLKAGKIAAEFYEALAPSEGKEDFRVAVTSVTLSWPRLEVLEIEIINRYENQEAI